MKLFPSQASVISVSELNLRARELIEAQFPLLWVAGEVSNFVRAASGHCYFSIKDANAQVRCVFFRHKAAGMDWKPENGLQVEVRALPTLYEARGEFQLTVETMRRAGAGALFEAFERLKQKLEAEGLFEMGRKKDLPSFPRTIGIVSSPKAAALQDVLTTLARRMPSVPVIIYPAPVQGVGAGEKIAQALRTAANRAEVDVIILCRGGGSMEDLWSFNEESVARAIADSPIPIVSGVGHETDFTITDFVADVRAPTPTAAAELVSPDRMELAAQLMAHQQRLARGVGRLLETRIQQVDYLSRRLLHPGERLRERARLVAQLAMRIGSATKRSLEAYSWRLAELQRRLRATAPDLPGHVMRHQGLVMRLRQAHARSIERGVSRMAALAAGLQSLNPQAVLQRGYSIVAKMDGGVVRSAEQLSIGERLRISFAQGAAVANVESTGKGDN
jgi:exodeoxyribonuclease VII large subunit